MMLLMGLCSKNALQLIREDSHFTVCIGCASCFLSQVIAQSSRVIASMIIAVFACLYGVRVNRTNAVVVPISKQWFCETTFPFVPEDSGMNSDNSLNCFAGNKSFRLISF